MKRLFGGLLLALITHVSAHAAGSTINPGIPAANSQFQSAPVRNNFAAAANDINNILSGFAGPYAPASPLVFQKWISANPGGVQPFVENIWDGAQWVPLWNIDTAAHTAKLPSSTITSSLGYTPLQPANNLNDIVSAATARANLGLPSSATVAVACRRIEEFGGVGDATTDNLAAWNAWVTAISGSSLTRYCIEFGAGTYKFSGAADIVVPVDRVLTIKGQGSGTTALRWDSVVGAGLSVAQQSVKSSVSFTGMSILTSVANNGAAISMSNSACLGTHPTNTFSDLYIGSTDYTGPGYWNTGINLSKITNVVVDNVVVFGDSTGTYHTNGVSYAGTATGGPGGSDPCYAIILDMKNSKFFSTSAGYVHGAYAQGVTIDSTQFTNGYYGIFSPSDTTGSNQLYVTKSQFNTSLQQILINGFLSNINISNNLIYVPTAYPGIEINSPTGSQYTINHNQFAAVSGVAATNNTKAVKIDAGASGVVQGNWIGNITTGIDLTGAVRFRLDGNLYDTNGVGTVVTPVVPGTGNLVDWSGVPTISSCGTSPPVPAAGSNNNGGRFTLGTGATTACTATFAGSGWPNNATCTVTPASNYTGTYYISAQSKTAFTVTLGTGTASVVFAYSCTGY